MISKRSVKHPSLHAGDDVFSVPESWVTDTSQNAFAEGYFNTDSIRALLELAHLLLE